MGMAAVSEVKDYLALYPPAIRRLLVKMREVVRKAAPGAEEVISYGLPTYKLNGTLLHFGAFKGHIGLYPGPAAIEEFAGELSPYECSKGAIRFPVDEPLPLTLVSRIVKHRIAQNLAKQKRNSTAKATGKSAPEARVESGKRSKAKPAARKKAAAGAKSARGSLRKGNARGAA